MAPLFKLIPATLALLLLDPASAFLSSKAHEDLKRDRPVRQVAVIGAGAAGSSTVYHLQKFAAESGVTVNLTLFESTDRVGGRTLTIDPFGNSSQRVELGASIFIEKNYILQNALSEFGLKPRDPDADANPLMGIWDGDHFVFTINENDSPAWNAAKMALRYGPSALYNTQKLVDTVVGKFLRLYESPYFPFRSLTQRAYELGLVHITGVTGEQLLKDNNIGDLYAHEMIQASTRANYASNLALIHGLDTMVSMAPQGAMAVNGGNWRIFHNMVERSGSAVFFNTSVSSIKLAPNDKNALSRCKYVLETTTAASTAAEQYPIKFDDVVIATPYQFSNISATEDVIQQPIDEIPYVQLHVTIFASPFQYSAAFFGLSNPKDVPGTVVTTLAKDDAPTSGVNGAGKAGFFSISELRKAVNPDTGREEYIYKIFSPEKVTPEFLSRLFGIKVPNAFVSKCPRSTPNPSPISWYHPHVFYSYPQALPRVTFQDPIIGPGLYYTSGMESFISTMETNALMGKNVARLIVDDMLGLETGGVQNEEEVVAEDQSTRVSREGAPKTRPTEKVFVDL